MNIVVELIIGHLSSSRRLVVPGFGAFMVKETGERVFSDLLRTDDGVLTSLLREKGMNEMEAAITVDRFIFEVRHELEQYGYCRLDELGTLRLDPDTKTLRLYPQVKGVVAPEQSTPYVFEREIEAEDSDEEQSEAEPQSKENGVSQGLLALYGEPKEGETENELPQEKVAEVAEKPKTEEPKTEEPAPVTPKPRKKPRKKSKGGVDWVIIVAVIVVVAALAVMAYGWYVSTKNVVDITADTEIMEAMDSLRIPLPDEVVK